MLLGRQPKFHVFFPFLVFFMQKSKKKSKAVETEGTTVRPCLESLAVVQSQQKLKIFNIPREAKALYHGPWYSASIRKKKEKAGAWTKDTTGSPW